MICQSLMQNHILIHPVPSISESFIYMAIFLDFFVFRDCIKPFEAPQRNIKMKIYINFFSSSGIGTWSVQVFLSFLNWIGVCTLFFLLKLSFRKLECHFILWSFSIQFVFFLYMNLPCNLTQNTVVISGLVPLITSWIYWLSYIRECVKALGPTLAASYDSLLKCGQAKSAVTLKQILLNGLNCFPLCSCEV